MVREVKKRVEGDPRKHRLELIQGDILKTPLPFFDVCVANLPYNISSPFLFKLLAHRPLFSVRGGHVQEEFAQRLSARPGDAVLPPVGQHAVVGQSDTTHQGRKEQLPTPPKVDSRVVRIELKNPPPPVNFVEWDGLVQLCFNQEKQDPSELIHVEESGLGSSETSGRRSRRCAVLLKKPRTSRPWSRRSLVKSATGSGPRRWTRTTSRAVGGVQRQGGFALRKGFCDRGDLSVICNFKTAGEQQARASVGCLGRGALVGALTKRELGSPCQLRTSAPTLPRSKLAPISPPPRSDSAARGKGNWSSANAQMEASGVPQPLVVHDVASRASTCRRTWSRRPRPSRPRSPSSRRRWTWSSPAWPGRRRSSRRRRRRPSP